MHPADPARARKCSGRPGENRPLLHSTPRQGDFMYDLPVIRRPEKGGNLGDRRLGGIGAVTELARPSGGRSRRRVGGCVPNPPDLTSLARPAIMQGS